MLALPTAYRVVDPIVPMTIPDWPVDVHVTMVPFRPDDITKDSVEALQ